MLGLADLLGDGETADPCACRPERRGTALVVDASECPGGGDLVAAPACRRTVVASLGAHPAEPVRTRAGGLEQTYAGSAAALLAAAGRFAEAVAFHDERLAALARRDPLAAAREAVDRADPVAAVGADSGLADHAPDGQREVDYETALEPAVAPTVSDWLVRPPPPPTATLVETRTLASGATVRVYEGEGEPPRYHLRPREWGFDERALAVLEAAHDRLGAGAVDGTEGAPGRAVRAVADRDDPVPALTRVLRKHTRGLGLLEDVFADPAVSDAFVTAPATENHLVVRAGGGTHRSNLRLTDAGVAALASRFRRESGRAFSRADPTLAAATAAGGRQVRVAGVTEPASDGTAFAFRAHDRRPFTLATLVANGTLTARAAALLALAVERGCALLVAGARGAGKTTLLGALLWALPAAVRTVVIEDAPELPVEALQAAGRDVQALRASGEGALAPAAALRTALRLGDGALVVGEVRGEEAAVLYEAMRVGASSEAVLGTIHGNGAAAVHERVVSDLGVPASSFGATDAVLTVEAREDGAGTRRRLRSVEEVVSGPEGRFEPLLASGDGGLATTGRLERGNSRLLAAMCDPGEDYGDLLEVLAERADAVAARARRPATQPRR